MRCYLVCYDISDPRRLHRVHQIMKGYGVPWQFSVFFCKLKNLDRARMLSALHTEIHHTEDQILILDLGPEEEKVRQNIHTLGRSLPPPLEPIIVL